MRFMREKSARMPSTSDLQHVCNHRGVENACGVTKGKSQEPRETWWWNEKLQEAVEKKKEAFKVSQQDNGNAEKKQCYKTPTNL